jgi:hypothetical protein
MEAMLATMFSVEEVTTACDFSVRRFGLLEWQ